MDTHLLYLYTPANSKINPPVETTELELPIDGLEWQDFEKLCLMLVSKTFSIDDCEIYGVPGQKQHGIDIFARKGNGKYSTYQCKRYQEVKTSDLKGVVKEFKNGNWASKTEEFVFCTTASLNDTALQNTFIELADSLKKDKISFIKWDKIQISRKLKDYPDIVYNFFGKEWVRVFNGPDKLEEVTKLQKLDANEVIRFRKKLAAFYSIVFNSYDPGIPSVTSDKPFLIEERFIIPDVIEEDLVRESLQGKKNNNKNEEAKYLEYGIHATRHGSFDKIHPLNADSMEFHERIIRSRISIQSIHLESKSNIIIGDPGSGKSTLLRYLALDILSNNPTLTNFSILWGHYLPVWLPFAFISKEISVNSTISIQEILQLWFKSHGKEDLYPFVKEALSDSRLLLLIDGVDEWMNLLAAKQALLKIQIHSKDTNSTVLYSSRPYGYKLMKEYFQDMPEFHLAPFSSGQQREYVYKWFQRWILSMGESDENLAKSETNKFMDELNKSNDLMYLAENPLLLSILIHQRRNSAALPNNKSKALEDICEHLVQRHPSKRKRDANISDDSSPGFDVMDVFSEMAIYVQITCNDGVILKEDAQKFIQTFLEKEMKYERLKAKNISEELIDIGANNIGIIVEKSPNELAFMHRQFQEFLAAKYLSNLDDNETNKIVGDYCALPSWHQVIMGYFSLIHWKKEQKFIDSLQAIKLKKQPSEDVLYVKFLLYELTLTLSNAPQQISDSNFECITTEFEKETDKSIKDALWKITLDSLVNTRIYEKVRNYLLCYYPNRYKFDDYRINAIESWSYRKLSLAQKQFLYRALINGNTHQKIGASNAIKKFIKDVEFATEVIELIKTCSNPLILPFAINSIISPDVNDSEKANILKMFKDSEDPIVRMMVIKLKIHLKAHTVDDLYQLLRIQQNLDYLLKNELLTILVSGWSDKEELFTECMKSVMSRRRYSFEQQSLDIDMAWNILFQCFNQNEEVIDMVIKEIQNEQFPFNLLIDRYQGWDIISKKFRNNKKLIPIVDEWIKKQQYNEMEVAFASQLGRTNSTKNYLIERLPTTTMSHWYISALIEGWSDDKDVSKQLKEYFIEKNKNSAFAVQFISTVFKDDPTKGIELLENILFDKNFNKDHIDCRDRTILPLIEINKEYFKNSILDKFMNEILPTLSKDDLFNSYFNALYPIVQNFSNEQIVKDFIFSKMKHERDGIDLIIRYYPEEKKLIDKLLSISRPIFQSYREILIEKLGRQNNDVTILKQLALFNQEADDLIKSTAAVNYFNIIKSINEEEIIEICKPKVFYVGYDYHVQRQIAFSGYLMTKRLPEYFSMQENGEMAIPEFSFSESYSEITSTMVNLMLDNFDYLLNGINGDFNRLSRFGNTDPQIQWGFWAKYSRKDSFSAEYILKYVRENETTITNYEIIQFLSRTVPRSILFRNILLRLLKSNSADMGVLAGMLLGENFNTDKEVFEIIKSPESIVEEGKIIALCYGWPSEKILKNFFDILVQNPDYHINRHVGYNLKFLFRDNENIMHFFKMAFDNYYETIRNHEFFIAPLRKRLERDIELQDLIKEELLSSTNTSMKISFYSILKSLHKAEGELRDWKNSMANKKVLSEYGYNILENKTMSFIEAIYKTSF